MRPARLTSSAALRMLFRRIKRPPREIRCRGSSSPPVTMMRAASSIWPSGSAGASSSASSSAASSVSANAESASGPSGRSSNRQAPAKGGRLTSFRGSRTTGWTVSPRRSQWAPKRSKLPPASMMKTLGRCTARAWSSMAFTVADLPEPVGPRISMWAFFLRSSRFRGSKVRSSPARLKKAMPGRPVPVERP